MVAVRTSEVKEALMPFLVLSLYFVYVDLKQYTGLTLIKKHFGEYKKQSMSIVRGLHLGLGLNAITPKPLVLG
jgi:hypothetical protein